MPLKGRIPLYLISGFLGSGKTTFINNLFDNYPGGKFGIIVNDFGEIGVDAAIIRKQEQAVIKELNNGQIFCSCLSGSFIESISAYKEMDIDYLLVETSGLAKPSPLMDIITAVRTLNGDAFAYRGMISLVDTSTYLELSKVLNAVDEQIYYSDIVLMNKIDRARERTAMEAEMKILSVNPAARIIRTEYGLVADGLLEMMEEKTDIAAADRRFSGWGASGRPVPVLLQSDAPVPQQALDDFIGEYSKVAYRIKGGIETDKGPIFVDCTADQKRFSGEPVKTDGLVIILPADDNIVKNVKESALKIFNQVS